MDKAASVTRRDFIRGSAALAVAGALRPLGAESIDSSGGLLKAAVIGHTGRGNYGHGLELIFNHRQDLKVVAVADPDEQGRQAAADRARALRQYADYREMLDKERPDLVSIAPRWTTEHHAMGMASLQAGAHIYVEKPFTTTLAEADELILAAAERGLKIAVAHQMRLAESVLHLKSQMDGGLIGDLIEIRSHGKQDRRAGGEDLMVLGTHLFDLMRFFAGDPTWCAARVLWRGRDIRDMDVRSATEEIGPVAGDEIFAHFGFTGGVDGVFVSKARYRETAGNWGMDLIGSKGVARIAADIPPSVYRLDNRSEPFGGGWSEWVPLTGDPVAGVPREMRRFAHANARVVDDWLAAVREDREPVCSGYAGMKAVEMAHSVYASAQRGGRVSLPLLNRMHPLL